VDVNLQDTDGTTALITASYFGQVDVVHELLQNNELAVNLQVTTGLTALYMASQNSHVDVVRELLRSITLDVNLQMADGTTALITASYFGHVEVVCELLQNNRVDVNLQHTSDCTALDMALGEKNDDVVRLLEKYRDEEWKRLENGGVARRRNGITARVMNGNRLWNRSAVNKSC
jgi:ankyrin repeat protein